MVFILGTNIYNYKKLITYLFKLSDCITLQIESFENLYSNIDVQIIEEAYILLNNKIQDNKSIIKYDKYKKFVIQNDKKMWSYTEYSK